jgi:hypothetical protein
MVIVSFAGRDPLIRAWAIEPNAVPPVPPFREAPLIVEDATVHRPPDTW